MSIKSLKTPLRYPGGKSKAIKTLSQWYPKNISEYREPFIGGGSIAIDVTKSNDPIGEISSPSPLKICISLNLSQFEVADYDGENFFVFKCM